MALIYSIASLPSKVRGSPLSIATVVYLLINGICPYRRNHEFTEVFSTFQLCPMCHSCENVLKLRGEFVEHLADALLISIKEEGSQRATAV